MLNEDQKCSAKCNRGLFFVCYQSSLDNGFYRQTTGFANNDFFPITTLAPQVIGLYRFYTCIECRLIEIGQDPIIGGPPKTVAGTTTDLTKDGDVTLKLINTNNEKYVVTGVAKKEERGASAFEQKFFTTSRGGEYYFVPSISTVKSWSKYCSLVD